LRIASHRQLAAEFFDRVLTSSQQSHCGDFDSFALRLLVRSAIHLWE
jgi:hypothetical protein